MTRWMTAALVASVVLTTTTRGQAPGPIEFGREPGIRASGEKVEDQSRFSGRADRASHTAAAAAYYGNVVISFPECSIVVRADEAIHDEARNQMALAGHVRIALDTR